MKRDALRAGAIRAGLAIVLAGCSRREPPPPPPPPAPVQVDKDILEAAMHQCFTVDCVTAHDRAGQIAKDSPLRETDEFRAIEYRFYAGQLLRAEAEPDFDKKRALLDQLRNDPSVDVGLRSAAGERLARLGGGRMIEVSLNGSGDGGADAGVDAGKSDAAQVALLMRSKKPADYQAARTLIEPRLYSGSASPDDIRAMTTICKAQKDNACLKTLKTLQLR
jgi:hypothetical protein